MPLMRGKESNMFVGIFDGWDDVASQYRISKDFPEPKHIYAEYEYENWQGYSTVVFTDDWETFGVVTGSHCSCYGLEGQWDPSYHSRKEIDHIYEKNKEVRQWLEEAEKVDG